MRGRLGDVAEVLAAPSYTTLVSGESPPWLWDATLNARFSFGTGFVAGPVVVDSRVLPFTGGDVLSIEAAGGATSALLDQPDVPPPAYPYVTLAVMLSHQAMTPTRTTAR